ncbi:MAG: three-Cys-motif partner protein TcmP [Bacteroidia bacterium]
MINKDYWDLTDNPHTELKLEMLNKYLFAWADILLAQYKRNGWKDWATLYYIDCFSGRGKYHKNGTNDCINGSPLIALENALIKQTVYKEKNGLDIKIKCVFIDSDKKSIKELAEFCKPYDGKVDYEIIQGDFNAVIGDVVKKTGLSPAFFFVDAGGISELKKDSVAKIISKRGARDIMVNYVVGGTRRVGGLAKSIFDGRYKGNNIEKEFKIINSLTDFAGMDVLKHLDKLDKHQKELLVRYVENVLEANNSITRIDDRLETIAYDMKHPDKADVIYYLLFSSRREVALKVMKRIFKDAKKVDYNGQVSMFDSKDEDFDI